MQSQAKLNLRRGLTLTESTGMLIDAAVERGRQQALERNQSELQAAREELRLLERQVRVGHELARYQRRLRFGLAVGACVLALAGGFGLGKLLWLDGGTEAQAQSSAFDQKVGRR